MKLHFFYGIPLTLLAAATASRSKATEQDDSWLRRGLSNTCSPPSLPSYLRQYSVITKENANIASANIYTGLVIGGLLFINNNNQIQIHSSNPNGLTRAERKTYYKELSGINLPYSRLQCNQCDIIQTANPLLAAGITWSDLENLANTITASVSGYNKVFVVCHGGTFNQADFLGLEAQDEDNGKTLVVFKTKEDIILDKTKYGRKWGPTVLAPFSKVTLKKGCDFIDGTVIARQFVSVDGGQHLHGDYYRGSIECSGPTCDRWPECGNNDWTCSDTLTKCQKEQNCYCDVDVHGDKFCFNDISCFALTPCTSNADCSTDYACMTSCCDDYFGGRPSCVPACGVAGYGVFGPFRRDLTEEVGSPDRELSPECLLSTSGYCL